MFADATEVFHDFSFQLMLSISGQEVATYWYSSMKRYDFLKRPSLLHTSINTGHFTQIVWKNTKFIGVGKSVSKTGKIFVVGECGTEIIRDCFQQNSFQLSTFRLAI
jgi:hypothetical protein